MKTNKILVGGIAGGIAFFFLGWLIYGGILKNYMAANSNQCMMKAMEQWSWWAMLLGELCWGFVLAVIFDWSKTSGWMEGAKKGAVFALLMGLAIDLGYYSMSTMFSNMMALIVDVVATVVMVAISGAIIAWAMGLIRKES
jgi:hypothetical protein